jgi:hypothetical protein
MNKVIGRCARSLKNWRLLRQEDAGDLERITWAPVQEGPSVNTLDSENGVRESLNTVESDSVMSIAPQAREGAVELHVTPRLAPGTSTESLVSTVANETWGQPSYRKKIYKFRTGSEPV